MRRLWILAAIAAVTLATVAEAGFFRCRDRPARFRLFARANRPAAGCGCSAGAGAAAAVSYPSPAAAGCAFCPQRE